TPFSFTAPAPLEISTLSLHDALPIHRQHDYIRRRRAQPLRHLGELIGQGAGLFLVAVNVLHVCGMRAMPGQRHADPWIADAVRRSEEHTSELQSRGHLVCRLLLEKKN